MTIRNPDPTMMQNTKFVVPLAIAATGLFLALVLPSGHTYPSRELTQPNRNDARPNASQSQMPRGSKTEAGPSDVLDLAGTIAEVISVPNYVYFRLRTETTGSNADETWVATNASKVSVGDYVTVHDAQLMTDFVSATLKRTFKRIYFGSLEPEAVTVASSTARDATLIHAAHVSLDADKNALPIVRVPKAKGPTGYDIAELYAARTKIQGTTVRVRGTVVKVTEGVLERNFVHLRDATGSRESQDDDLTITTLESVAVGRNVLFEGVLKTDVDFGSGYQYRVLLESGRLVTE